MRQITILALLFASATILADKPHVSAQIQVPSVLVKLLDQVEVPAREAGVLTNVAVREGSLVEEDAILAKIDDKEIQFTKERADLELQIATKNAASDVSVRSAEKSLKVADDELQRAQQSVDRISKSISKTELDRLLLAADQGKLALEKAKQDLSIAELTKKLKDVELRSATRHVERRQILAPFPGVVVQVNRQRGEWVEPGEKLLRLVRIDRLRAEGYMHARDSLSNLEGKGVTLKVMLPNQIEATFTGKLTFVSPEIDPVNGQVRILADIENPSLLLRPGLKGSLVIETAPPAEK